MSVWTGRLLIVAAVLWFGGWVLVLLFGDSEGVGDMNPGWTLGGLMVYAWFPVLVLAGVTELTSRLRRWQWTRK
jgi:hypothetical protein